MLVTDRFSLRTGGHCDMIDITPEVEGRLSRSGAREGTVTLFVPGSTAGITTIEYEPGLIADFKAMWERLAPSDIAYDHDRRWGDGNGYSHVRASLLGPSLAVPFAEGRLALGDWQQIVLVDFDNRPRSRQVVVQIAGQ
ncbi:MAG: YjbQ family protein [Chloroflexi bacterium]|nr:YjbQ family protein [Chloroflexota bacterium]